MLGQEPEPGQEPEQEAELELELVQEQELGLGQQLPQLRFLQWQPPLLQILQPPIKHSKVSQPAYFTYSCGVLRT